MLICQTGMHVLNKRISYFLKQDLCDNGFKRKPCNLGDPVDSMWIPRGACTLELVHNDSNG